MLVFFKIFFLFGLIDDVRLIIQMQLRWRSHPVSRACTVGRGLPGPVSACVQLGKGWRAQRHFQL